MSLPNEPLFVKTQDAYSTVVADSIAPAGHTAFNWRRAAAIENRTPEQIKGDAHRADSLRRYYARVAKEKAERVNPESVSGFSSGMALHRKEIRTELERATA